MNYTPLTIRPTKGLSQTSDDLIAPDEATVANNVDHSGGSLARRKGYRNACAGTLDATIRGGAAAQSISLVPEEWWLHTPAMRGQSYAEPSAASTGGRRDFFNERPGFFVIPEGAQTGIRLDVQAGDPDWAFELLINTDQLPVFPSNYNAMSSALMKPIVIQKGFGVNGQWAVRLIPDATSTDRFYAVLTLYEGGVLGAAGTPAGVDFFYNGGAGVRAWIEPGKRVWLAWKFIDDASGDITSYYRLEGQTSAVSSTQDVNATSATLRTNGVGTGTYPITGGRRPYQGAGRVGGAAGSLIDEIAFSGSISEVRFWLESAQGGATTLELPANWGTVTAAPPASTDWYVESEIPAEQLTTDAAIEASNLVQTTDLQIYWQFKPELVGATPAGVVISGENHRMIRPRFTRGTATDNVAWLTGADVTWVPGTGSLGTYALAFIPAGPSGQKYAYADVMRSGDLNSIYGQRIFSGGLRIPNADSYVRKSPGAAGNTFPDEFTGRFVHRCDAQPSNVAYKEVLGEMCAVRQGAGPNQDRYFASAIWQLAIIHNGADWIYRFSMRDGAGAPLTLDSTTLVVEGAINEVAAGVKFDTAGQRFMAVFVNGVREATRTDAASKPWMSQASGVDPTAPNVDTDDGRTTLFPFQIGYSVETNTAATPTNWIWRCGAWGSGAGAAGSGPIGATGLNRSYWAFHTDDTPFHANDGIGYRGHDAFVGVMGSVQVWHRFLGESEHRGLVNRGPTSEEMQRDGALLLSNWTMEDGQGCLAFDSGFLKNHLRINPFPTTGIAAGACSRVNRPPLLGIWQRRLSSSAGTATQEVYTISHGVIHRIYRDGSGNRYVKPIGRCQTPEMWDPALVSWRLPTAFQFNNAIYVCTGLGAVKCISNDRVTDAGLTPFYGDPGTDQTTLGWREPDRDGTFAPTAALDAGAPADAIFQYDRKYGWIVTPYDAERGIEGAPSQPMYLTVRDLLGTTNGWLGVQILLPPRSPQRQASKVRIYRTATNGGVFKFLGEIPADQGGAQLNTAFYDQFRDIKLGLPLDSWLNYPPPLNARIGLAYGSRALYFGVPENPDTMYYSRQGQPGACPSQYQIRLAAGRSTELTAGLVLNGRCYLFTRHAAYIVTDVGGDISIDSQDLPPIQVEPLRDDLGCISHHGIVTIEGVGAIIPTERGLYLFNGVSFIDIGRPQGRGEDRIALFWSSLNMTASRNFVGIANRRKKQYILYCSTTATTDGRNDRALVWDWVQNAFTLQTNVSVIAASAIADETTGQERIWCTSYNGNIFEFDPPDLDVNSDGVVAAPYSGAIQDRKLDPLGSGKYSRLKLVTNSSLPTAGDGLRGVNLYVTDAGIQWHTTPLRVLWNDANWVHVEPTAAGTTSPTGFEWRLGAIAADWTSGYIGGDVKNLKVIREQVNFAATAGTALYATIGYETLTPTSRTLDPSLRRGVVAGILGRGRRIQYRFHDTALYGGLPNNPWEVEQIEFLLQPRGRATYVANAP